MKEENARQTQQLVRLALDAAFLVGGVFYGGRVLKRLPMTYLSEIAFPFDVRYNQSHVGLLRFLDLTTALLWSLLQFCVKMVASLVVFVMQGVQWMLAVALVHGWTTQDHAAEEHKLLLLLDALVWVSDLYVAAV